MRGSLFPCDGLRRVSFVLGILCTVSVTLAGTRTWDGSSGTDWFTADNWTPSGVPTNGDHVVIDASAAPATNVIVSAQTAALGSLSITNAVLTFTNWTTTLNATNVTIGSGGLFTLPGAFTNTVMSNRIHVACATFSLQPGGSINVDGKGFVMNSGAGAGTFSTSGTDSGGGGSHGGAGGRGWRTTGGYPGNVYDFTNAPVAPGSGGGGTATYLSGAGGGAVRIDAPGGTVSVNGIISANGTNGNAGGSGGSIYISCGMFSDSTNGVLSANGGSGSGGGGGGGGRIAVQYTSLVNSSGIQFSTSPGSGYYGNDRFDVAAGKGTLHLSDTALLSSTLSGGLFSGVKLYATGFSSWSVGSLAISNCSVDLAEPGFQLTVSNNLMIATNGALGLGSEAGTALVGLICGGHLVLTNGGSLSVYSGFTNAVTDFGALVSVTNDVLIGPGSWIYPYSHSTNGGSALFRMRDLLISTNGGFNALGRGYATGQGPGKGGPHASRAGGGGYGGRGGDSDSALNGGNPYGSTNTPAAPGSGSTTYNRGGGRGGGLVRIEAARRVGLNGMITAKGGANVGGGGSGGGIYVQCATLDGAGTVNADGGNAATANHGAGGGGRIALVVKADTLTGTTPGTYVEYAGSAKVSVNAGTGGYAGGGTSSKNGTFYLFVIPAVEGTVVTFK